MTKKVDALDWALRADWNAWESWVVRSGGKRLGATNKDRHLYIDRGGSVLAVAHLDSVQAAGPVNMGKSWMTAPTIDNRLGAWLVAFELPRRGVKVDLLLTDNEERGASTAAYFEPGKSYNWMFSFDRSGDDVVMYQYDTRQAHGLLQEFGFKVGYGSYSDICDLSHLGVGGFNFGCGMFDYHSKAAWCDLGILRSQVDRFAKFHGALADEIFEHVPADYSEVYPHGDTSAYYWSSDMFILHGKHSDDGVDGGLYGDDRIEHCDFCEQPYFAWELENRLGGRLCEYCIRKLDGVGRTMERAGR